ncbi:MAG TPA: NAD(P)/FAD-dependent oxidoreductase [Gammaproteobacteria bacterium]|jgi:nitrite reductase (NADH) large subunit|nr:NAD(P)/FAD-dependent oxidoreductase [Gammaproteobacteria bacterium]MBT3893181.1 NAD(P)/FAD-dependent oxidoreductase [Gammaproteobacteria bacterium]HIJ33436.1 NAD(P)/FAD-dependent oxidoreductase [Gammaproteobacteria bacterium]
MREKLVVIGNGMAGMRTVEELLKVAPQQYEITVIGDEPHPNYNRIMLSPLLAGDKQFDDIILNTPEWYSKHNINLLAGTPAASIHRGRREVTLADQRTVHYDRLLLATGSLPFILPIPGNDLEGVIGFRTLEDVESMINAAQNHKHAVIIGGGLLGLEAANGLKRQGMSVTVVHISSVMMNQQLDDAASQLLKRKLEDDGLKFLLEAETEAILGKQRVEAVRFKDGLEIPADLVVMAVGIRPSIDLAKSSGLYCNRGVVVSDTMQSYDPKIYAVGECVEHRGTTYGLVAPLFEQAKVVANHLAQYGIGIYSGSVTSTKLKVTGVDLFSAGNFREEEGDDVLLYQDPNRGIYKKLVLANNRIKGAVLYGDTIDGARYFQMMRDSTDVTELRDSLLFRQAHLGDSGHGDLQVMSLPDNAEVCGCNGVCKGDITQAIHKNNLFTLDEVRSHTKASASCGSCTALVEQILASTVGEGYEETPNQKPVCGCTTFPHDQVQKAIKTLELKSHDAVFHALEWKNSDGCHICRPAVNYYILAAWPGEYDDPQSRFVNERAHGNIQKDGSYSVVPRMWGGLTTPDELRAIADVADKFKVPEVKVTGGQRIDLFGIQKEDLPALWSDLNEAGFVSGHAYGKAMRTVKTCVGSQWCRFGTQDSTGLGVKLEQLTWGSWMPHKFKLAVSGCPRNCAEATIKDFGVVCVDSGYELHIGGNGGIKVRVTDLLTKVDSEEEVMEYCAAFTQFYREDAYYLERTAPWVERVGLHLIKEKVVENETLRKELAERFAISQQSAQIDPWEQHAAGTEAAQTFMPMASL